MNDKELREKVKRLFDYYTDNVIDAIVDLIRTAVMDERERCVEAMTVANERAVSNTPIDMQADYRDYYAKLLGLNVEEK